MRALVVDDSKTMRSVLRMILKGSGFEVTEAGNGREALASLETSGTPDVALVDWNMPEMNGYEFLCAARSRPELETMKIVMVTTETELGQMQNALQRGADEYVMKPFTRDSITEKLQLLGLNGQAS